MIDVEEIEKLSRLAGIRTELLDRPTDTERLVEAIEEEMAQILSVPKKK